MAQNLRNNFILFYIKIWLPTVAYCGLIFYLSSLTIPIEIEQMKLPDKALHFIEYGVLSILFFFSLKKSMPDHNIKTIALLSILFSSLYGVSDEIHQYFVPGRESSMGDVMADFIGAVIFQSRNILVKT